jgi:phosphinothricin acetyltransferase
MEPAVVRPAVSSDAPACNEIYAHYVATSHVTFDVDPPDLSAREAWVRAAGVTDLDQRIVAERSGRIVGWGSSAVVRPKPAYAGSAEVTVYVAPAAVGTGVGTALLGWLLDALRRAGAHRAYGVIALPNPASEALFTAAGFSRVGVLSEAGRKFGRWWDVAWYECPL